MLYLIEYEVFVLDLVVGIECFEEFIGVFGI